MKLLVEEGSTVTVGKVNMQEEYDYALRVKQTLIKVYHDRQLILASL